MNRTFFGINFSNPIGLAQSKVYAAAFGSGFSISLKGHIITNNHVIKRCQEDKPHVGGETLSAKVLSRDKVNDFALLKANFNPKKSVSY